MVRLHNLTIKPRRVPSKAHKEEPMSIGEFVIVTCDECDTELAMSVPFDKEPVLCANHDRPQTRFEVGEDVIAFDE